VLLPNGKVLVAGGSDGKGHNLSSAELYDPATEKWMETGSMNYIHWNSYTMILLPDGKVLLTQGHSGDDSLSKELYDPTTEKWTVITNK
jgi:hypothetical protein